MPEQERSGPESSKAVPSGAELLRELPDEGKFQTDLSDLSDLASRFSTQNGGGLAAELSADLALEIVLNEIVEQACLATGATGAAVVLERDGEMVCRASSGPTAPELGSKLDTFFGLSGECFKTRRTQWCDDVLADTRVDIDASGRLGVRSLVVMPLLRGADLVGVIELFSARPYAFGVRDQRTLEVLADRTLNNLEHVSHPLNRCSDSEVPSMAIDDRPEEVRPLNIAAVPVHSLDVSELEAEANAGDAPRRRRDAKRFLSGVCALVCAVVIGLVLGRQWGARPTNSQPQPALNTSGSGAPTVQPASAVISGNPKAGNSNKSADSNALATSPAKPSSRRVPPGGLLVLQNGAEVFRLPPNKSAAKVQKEGARRPSSPQPESAVEMRGASADGSLLHRVEPEYPEAARQQNVQGPVVLDVHIGADGAVQEVRVGSGQPLLAQAATDAVKQWKFKPRLINGSPVEMQTRVTLNFRLPQ